ncbi:hypothetical protein LPW26_22670 [Rhodopseudomonas sp. HC1]|uniref:hypothetical protein n=1 Tax=Rhodopseudomonas infernalis TaxID=2897386 RepID=UPI001EE7BB27|nr:hypothetical protein [Rhodopseudomonas infernalis]MCG6207461.1 hypothetical protein [Rhodopseudomonas infernalis]
MIRNPNSSLEYYSFVPLASMLQIGFYGLAPTPTGSMYRFSIAERTRHPVKGRNRHERGGRSCCEPSARNRIESISPAKSRSLLAASLTHALHDGDTDSLYAFPPVWPAQFGLSYAALAVVRALYFGTMGGMQIPAHRVVRGLSPRAALILSTVAAARGLLIMALPLGFAGLCVGLVVAGIGSSIQHPRGSMLVTDSYGAAARRPLGIYNVRLMRLPDATKRPEPTGRAYRSNSPGLHPIATWRLT